MDCPWDEHPQRMERKQEEAEREKSPQQNASESLNLQCKLL